MINKRIDPLLYLTLIIQIVFLLVLFADFIFHINFLRFVIGFIYLSFVPGALILRYILKENITRLEPAEFILYSTGISLSLIAFIGYLDNIILSFIKFTLKPFSLITLIATIQIFIFIFWILNYITDNRQYLYNLQPRLILKKSVIIPLYLPLLTVISMYFINYHNNNILSLIVIILIVVLIVSTMYIKNYLTTLWTVALSLLYLNSLLGYYFRPTDNIVEIGIISTILKNGFWNPTLPANINSMLNVVIVLPIYSIICSINIVYIYRYIVPLFSALLPVGLYIAISKITNKKIAFLSCIFYITMYEYYTWLGLTMKMVTASLFLVLILLTLNTKKLSVANTILLIIFLISLSISHYGTSYIFMFGFVGTFFISMLLTKTKYSKEHANQIFNLTIILVYIVFTISWYIYSSFAAPYMDMVTIVSHIIKNLLSKHILAKHSYGYQLVKGKLPEYLQILKLLYFISVIFIIIGLAYTVFKKKFKFYQEYIIFSVLFFIAGGSIFLGGLSGAATPDRIYQIICIFLSPFCIIGGSKSVECLHLKKFFKKIDIKLISYTFVVIYLIIFFLFNTCFIAEVVYKHNVGPVISISKPRIVKRGSIREKEYLDRVCLSLLNVKGAEWLWQHISSYQLYCGRNSRKNFAIAKVISSVNSNKRLRISRLTNKPIYAGSYIYLNSFNTKTRKIKVTGGMFPKFNNLKQITRIYSSNKIYTNSRCDIYYYL